MNLEIVINLVALTRAFFLLLSIILCQHNYNAASVANVYRLFRVPMTGHAVQAINH